MFKRRKPDEAAPGTPATLTTGADEALLDGGMQAPGATTVPPRRPDSGIGVPPFRPADKEAPYMGRFPVPRSSRSSAGPTRPRHVGPRYVRVRHVRRYAAGARSAGRPPPARPAPPR